ncbi:hypothetical protein ON010_g11313 [Phytophthora cinnamomi]|nr:hypothetical protein ON010_g11313 [Phytophthora cinnamomi]
MPKRNFGASFFYYELWPRSDVADADEPPQEQGRVVQRGRHPPVPRLRAGDAGRRRHGARQEHVDAREHALRGAGGRGGPDGRASRRRRAADPLVVVHPARSRVLHGAAGQGALRIRPRHRGADLVTFRADTFALTCMPQVEKEEHEGWTEKEAMVEANNRFEAIRQAEEAEALRAYREAKQQALLESAEPPPKPRTKATTFRYPHCIPVLRTSKRFMRAAMSEKKPRVVRSPVQKRRRRQSKHASEGDEASESSDASGDLHERVSPHGAESSPKRRKGSEASSAASGSASGSSSSSSPSDESSDEGVPAPKGFVVPQAGQPTVARGNHVARAAAQNGGFASNAQVIKNHRTQQKANYRLKLLAELRGIVETISQLGTQLSSSRQPALQGAASPMGVAAVDPTLAEEVQQDLRFFRDQKRASSRSWTRLTRPSARVDRAGRMTRTWTTAEGNAAAFSALRTRRRRQRGLFAAGSGPGGGRVAGKPLGGGSRRRGLWAMQERSAAVTRVGAEKKARLPFILRHDWVNLLGPDRAVHRAVRPDAVLRQLWSQHGHVRAADRDVPDPDPFDLPRYFGCGFSIWVSHESSGGAFYTFCIIAFVSIPLPWFCVFDNNVPIEEMDAEFYRKLHGEDAFTRDSFASKGAELDKEIGYKVNSTPGQ